MIPEDINQIGDGYWLHSRGTSWISHAITRLLGSWGSHDAIFSWRTDAHGVRRLGVVEATFGHGVVWTPINVYIAEEQAKKCEVKVLKPTCWTCLYGARVAASAERRIGRPYDYWGIVRLLLKYALVEWFHGPAGWEFADWCTEMCNNASIAAGVDLLHKKNPTPKTVEKRMEAGVFVLISGNKEQL